MMLADLHIHSKYSDGKLSIPDLVDFYGKRGFKVIAITDHLCEEETFLGKASLFLKKTLSAHNFHEYLETIKVQGKRALKQYGMLVIAGVEITKNSLSFHRSAHILAVGITDYISADGSILEILKKIKAQGALAIAAHPVSTKKIEHQTYHLWDQRQVLAEYFDAWEVASGPHIFEEVMNSGLPIIASSDFHHEKHIRSWKSLLNCELNLASIKSAIREQKIEFTFYEDEAQVKSRMRISLSHSGSSSGRSWPALG